MSYLDARYDQGTRHCACGSAYFVGLTLGQVHEKPELGVGAVQLLPPYAETAADRAAVGSLPIVECVRCRTRYDQRWQEVV